LRLGLLFSFFNSSRNLVWRCILSLIHCSFTDNLLYIL
jgi:hypothetical protein